MRLSLTPPTAATTLQGDLTLLIQDMVAAGSAEGRKLSETSLKDSLNAYYLLYAVRPTSHRSAVASYVTAPPCAARPSSPRALDLFRRPVLEHRARSSS